MSQCAICFSTSQSPFTTKCNHTFCNKCLLQWMLENDSCPICRYSISKKDSIARPDIELDDEIDENGEPMFTIYVGKNFNKKYNQILESCIDDFINTYKFPDTYYPIFRWKERKRGFYDVRVKQNNMYVTFRFEVFKSTSVLDRFVINVYTSTKYIKKFNEKPKPNKFRMKKDKHYRRCP